LANTRCKRCRGRGYLPLTGVCRCVCRAVFRAVYKRFRRCAEAAGSACTVTFDHVRHGVDAHRTWVRRNEDYCADFHLAGRRALSPELYRVFSFAYLLGAGPKLAAKRLRVGRSKMGEWTAEVQLRVGREIIAQQPYSLYPPHLYFEDTVAQASACDSRSRRREACATELTARNSIVFNHSAGEPPGSPHLPVIF
jgi:hypothetical protein